MSEEEDRIVEEKTTLEKAELYLIAAEKDAKLSSIGLDEALMLKEKRKSIKIAKAEMHAALEKLEEERKIEKRRLIEETKMLQEKRLILQDLNIERINAEKEAEEAISAEERRVAALQAGNRRKVNAQTTNKKWFERDKMANSSRQKYTVSEPTKGNFNSLFGLFRASERK